MAAVIGFSYKEQFLRFQLLFPDFYHFHHVIWGMKWAKKLKTKNGQNMSSGPFFHDAAHMLSHQGLFQAFQNSKLGGRVGLVLKALAFHQRGPGLTSTLAIICGSSVLVLYSAMRGFSPGTPDFPSHQKPTFDLI